MRAGHEVRLDLLANERWQLFEGELKIASGNRQGLAGTQVVVPLEVMEKLIRRINTGRWT